MESKKVKNISLATMTLLFVLAAFPAASAAQYGAATTATQARETPTTQNPLELWVFLDNPRVISGKMIPLTVQVVWRLGVKVDLDNLTKADFSPFKVEQITIGEREIFDNTHDYRVIQYLLSLPGGLKHGEYTVPSFSIPYFNEVDKTSGAAVSTPIILRKVPILVEARLDKDVFDIGDKIKYTLTIHAEKNVKVLLENLERFNFEPFELLDTRIYKKTTGRLETTVIEYSLAIYEIGTEKVQYEIPSIPVTYYIEPEVEQKVFRAEKGKLQTSEYKTPFIPVYINSLLKAVDVPLEGVKGPSTYPKYVLCKRSYFPITIGVSILFVIGVIEFKRIKKKLPSGPKTPVIDTGELAAKRLSWLVSSYRTGEIKYDDKEFLVSIDSALRVLLGTQVGISRETALSLTTSQFVEDYISKRLSRELAEQSRDVLKHLDMIIFGRDTIAKDEVERLLTEVEALQSALRGSSETEHVTGKG